jgi:hypothetical protein
MPLFLLETTRLQLDEFSGNLMVKDVEKIQVTLICDKNGGCSV